MFLGALPKSLLPTLNRAKKCFIHQARNGNPTAWLNDHYHTKCKTNSDLASIFPFNPKKDEDDEEEEPERCSVASALNALQKELLLNLHQRAIRLYQVSGAKIAEHQRYIHNDEEDENDQLETPTVAKRKKKTRVRHEFKCQGPLCKFKRRSYPQGGATVQTATAECSQCKQYGKSLQSVFTRPPTRCS